MQIHRYLLKMALPTGKTFAATFATLESLNSYMDKRNLRDNPRVTLHDLLLKQH